MPGGADVKIIIDAYAIVSEGQACADLAPHFAAGLEELMHPSLAGVKAADWSDISPICDEMCNFADAIAAGREKIRYMIRDVSKTYAGMKA